MITNTKIKKRLQASAPQVKDNEAFMADTIRQINLMPSPSSELQESLRIAFQNINGSQNGFGKGAVVLFGILGIGALEGNVVDRFGFRQDDRIAVRDHAAQTLDGNGLYAGYAGFLRILGALHDLQLVGAVSNIAKRQNDAHHKNQIAGFFAQTALSALISAQNITPPRMLRSVCRYMPRKARKGTISKSDRPVEYTTPKTARPK